MGRRLSHRKQDAVDLAARDERREVGQQRGDARDLATFVMRIARELTLLAALAAALALLTISTSESAMPSMKAIVIHQYGGPEVLKYEDVPRPVPKDDQLLVRVIAAGVNPVDGMIRSGMFAKGGSGAFPMILGGDIAGIIEKIGSKITKFKAGDPVFAYVSLDNNRSEERRVGKECRAR